MTNEKLPYLARWRARRGLKQSELAKRAKITREQISYLENQHKAARLGTVEKLANALRISTEQLREEPPTIMRRGRAVQE